MKYTIDNIEGVTFECKDKRKSRYTVQNVNKEKEKCDLKAVSGNAQDASWYSTSVVVEELNSHRWKNIEEIVKDSYEII